MESKFLQPVDIKKLPRGIDEQRLIRTPDSLHSLVELLWAPCRCIWVNQQVFLRLYRQKSTEIDRKRQEVPLPDFFRNNCSELTLVDQYLSYPDPWLTVRVHGFTQRAASQYLACLSELPDDRYKDRGFDEDFPLGNSLQRFLSPERDCILEFIDFTAEQSRILANCQMKKLCLLGCNFLDGGRAFTEELIMRRERGQESSPLVLELCSCFDYGLEFWDELMASLPENWTLILNQMFSFLHHNCPSTPAPAVERVELHLSYFRDGGAPLVDACRLNRGPRRLMIAMDGQTRSRDLLEPLWSPFMDHLSHNTHLQELRISKVIIPDRDMLEALSRALRTNQALTSLSLDRLEVIDPQAGLSSLLEGITVNTSLQSINLDFVGLYWQRVQNEEQEQLRLRATTNVKTMLVANPRILKVTFHDRMYNAKEWQRIVAPILEINRRRGEFQRLQRSANAGLLAHAMGHVANKPHMLWVVVQQNQPLWSPGLLY